MEHLFIVVLAGVFLLIVFSLLRGLWFLARDGGRTDQKRVVKALTVRIALALLLFALLMAGGYFGLL